MTAVVGLMRFNYRMKLEGLLKSFLIGKSLVQR
jgi:hypothetical protein